MSSNTAPESKLNELHSVVAQVLIKQLGATDKLTIGEGEEQVEVEMASASPALIQAAIKFLKDNNISTTPEEDENLQSLADVLEHKRKMGSIHLLPAATKAAGED